MKKKIIIIIIILVAVGLLVTGIIVFNKKNNEKKYDELIIEVEKQAKKWAEENNINQMTKISVSKLIESKYINPNKNNNLINPIDNSDMKCYLIQIVIENDNYVAKFLDEKNCDFIELEKESDLVTLTAYEKSTNKELVVTNNMTDWIADTVVIKASLPDGWKDIVWYVNDKVVESINDTELEISSDIFMNVKVRVQFIREEENLSKSINVRIDNAKPTTPIVKKNDNSLNIVSYDSGSGINRYEYSVDEINWSTISETDKNSVDISLSDITGTIYVRVIDNVNNVSDIVDVLI